MLGRMLQLEAEEVLFGFINRLKTGKPLSVKRRFTSRLERNLKPYKRSEVIRVKLKVPSRSISCRKLFIFKEVKLTKLLANRS